MFWRRRGPEVDPPEFADVKTDSFWPEILLFLLSFNFAHRLWQKRCKKWLTHVNVFASLKADPDSRDWNETRITFLMNHLNILDTKFNMLLTVNTLLLIAVNGLINSPLPPKPLGPNTTRFVAVFWALWLVTTAICLIGERRLVWGDLGLIGKRRPEWQGLKKLAESRNPEQPNDFKSAVEGHVNALIVAVAKRTNKFRVAVRLTYLNVIFSVLTFVAAFLKW
jgi:hypothetical protein